MAVELSSNWKKLQAKIKAEPSKKPSEKPSQKVAGKKPESKPVTGKRPRGREDDNERQKRHQQHQNEKPQKKTFLGTKQHPFSSSSSPKMGVAQSSSVSKEVEFVPDGKSKSTTHVTPSVALWAKDHDISPEDLAQAYGLGVSKKAGPASDAGVTMAEAAKGDRENAGMTPGMIVGKYISIDCEMVGIGEGGHDDALARVSIVDFFGRQVYDSYVKPKPGQRVTDWRTHVSGVSSRHMRFARPFDEVQRAVDSMLKGDDGTTTGPRILIGHDVKHDMKALEISHPPRLIRDTAKFSGFKQYGHGPKPALRVLARVILGVVIQEGEHSSVEDARATMQLFRQYKSAFDMEAANRFGDERAGGGGGGSNKNQKKKKKNKH